MRRFGFDACLLALPETGEAACWLLRREEAAFAQIKICRFLSLLFLSSIPTCNKMQTLQLLWSPSLYRVLFLFFFSVFANSIRIQARIVLPENVRVPALFAFGDSIVDPGNNNHLLTQAKANYPPYGQDFMGGKPTGRFCNGKIPTDLLADELGISELIPAYHDPALKPEDLLKGVSFASGGAGYIPFTSQVAGATGLLDQLNLFKEYTGKLRTYVDEATAASIISESVYVVVIGSDDISNTYFGAGLQYKYDPNSYTDLMVQKASSFFQELHDLGAQKIGAFGVPPIGCVPSQRTVQGGIQRDCGKGENELATLFNSKLSSAVNQLTAEFTPGKIVYVDVYTPLLDIIQNPGRYGFEVVNKGCCGTGLIEVTLLCNSFTAKTCADVSKYVFWDSYHPSQRAYEALVHLLLEKYKDTLL